MAIPWAGIGSVIGGLGSIFGGGSKKGVDPGHAIRKQAWGAREAAREYGFNPLTMLQYGQPGAAMAGSGAPPLASIDLIVGGLKDISDETSGDAARRRTAEQLELDLAKVKLDQARSGVVVPPPPPVAAGVGAGPSPLGRRATIIPTMGGTAHAEGRVTMANRPPESPIRRNREMIPVIYPDGKEVMIPRGVADRLDVKPFGTLIGGDIEELKGEFVGNVETTARAADISSYVHSGDPVDPIAEMEFDEEGKKWVPPFTDPKSDSWWKRPIW